jgi:hypothetical protein
MACGGYPGRLRRAGTDLGQAGTDPGADASPLTILAPTPVKLLGEPKCWVAVTTAGASLRSWRDERHTVWRVFSRFATNTVVALRAKTDLGQFFSSNVPYAPSSDSSHKQAATAPGQRLHSVHRARNQPAAYGLMQHGLPPLLPVANRYLYGAYRCYWGRL